MNKLIKKLGYQVKLERFKNGGQILKFQNAGKLPIGTQAQYDHAVAIYQSLVDKGVNPQAALDLVNQKIAEKGWRGWVTGDNKRYPSVDKFTNHLIEWHGRMYPDSLNAENFNEFYRGVNGTREQNDKAKRTNGRSNSGRNYYNTEKGWNGYRKDLLQTRPGVKKRINYYRSLQNLPPLVYQEPIETNTTIDSLSGIDNYNIT